MISAKHLFSGPRMAVCAGIAVTVVLAGTSTPAFAHASSPAPSADATTSTLTAPFGSVVPARGAEVLLVTLRDRNGVPVAGKNVVLVDVNYAKGVKDNMRSGTGTTGADGTAQVAVTSSVAQSLTLAAQDTTDNVRVAEQQVVTFQ